MYTDDSEPKMDEMIMQKAQKLLYHIFLHYTSYSCPVTN